VTLFHVVAKSHRGHTVGVVGETDLAGWEVVGPDGEECDWSFGDHKSRADEIAARLNRLYATADEVVRCRTCGAVVTSGDPQRYPYCRSCHYVGNAAEDVRAATLSYFRETLGPVEVRVDHTGGGCFWLAIQFPESETFYVLTDGEASLPTDENGDPIRGGWGYVGLHSEREEDWDTPEELRYIAEAMDDPSQGLSDEQAAALVLADYGSRLATRTQ
jgi:hypothetical protein